MIIKKVGYEGEKKVVKYKKNREAYRQRKKRIFLEGNENIDTSW